jgi:murein DD-endopeptidase MepM/ murein hydrolase activator NlpD
VLEKFHTTLRSVQDQLSRIRRQASDALRHSRSRLDTFAITPPLDRARIDVIRHRITSGFYRQRQMAVALFAVVGLSLAVATTNATIGGDPAPAAHTAVSAEDAALLERQAAADRADRGSRGEPAGDDSDENDSDEEDDTREGSSGSAAAQASPTPEPEPEPTKEPEPDWVHPMPGARTTSCFGQRWGTLHAGVDLAAPHGTPIHAVGAGTVTHSGWVFGGYGISVVIDHGDGHLTHYAHASATKVSRGDRVKPGDVIALEGSTGDSTGPHLHFEVHKGGLWNAVEPTRWLANRGVKIPGC